MFACLHDQSGGLFGSLAGDFNKLVASQIGQFVAGVDAIGRQLGDQLRRQASQITQVLADLAAAEESWLALAD